MTAPMLGVHVHGDDPVGAALARGAFAVQFFFGDPQGWGGPDPSFAGGAEALRRSAEAAGVSLYVHAPYVINVATTNNSIRIPSRKLLTQHAAAAASVGATGLIVHGGHLPKDVDASTGVDNWRKALEHLDGASAPDRIPLLVENTAGGDNAVARHWSRLELLWRGIAGAAAAHGVDLGFCLDTCHAHAAGEPLDGIVERTLDITGRIDLIHCNDSRDAFGSGADRHANLGRGRIPAEGLVEVARAGAPVICETPGAVAEHTADLGWLRARLADPGAPRTVIERA